MFVDGLQAILLTADLLVTLHTEGASVAHLDHLTEVGADQVLLTTAAGDHTHPTTDVEVHILLLEDEDRHRHMKFGVDPTLDHGPLTAGHQCVAVTGL